MELKKKLFKFLPSAIQKKIKHRYYFKKFNNATSEEEKDLIVLTELINPGDIVLDIGANFGLYSKFLSQLTGEMGKVYSFEPVPDTFEVLQYNINKSKLTNVKAFKKAVSDQMGEAFISIPEYDDGSENYYEASLKNTSSDNGFRIETIRLDDFILETKTEKIDFMKMDVEGHEPEALAGAEKLIEKFHPKMMIEINDGFEVNSTGAKVLNFLERFNYKMFYYDGNILRESAGKEAGVNFIFLQPLA